MRQVISDLLLDIASEKNGYSVGKPWRFTEFSLAAIVPISRVTQETRNYKLLSEVGKLVKIKDTGDISKVELTNKDEYPVLVKMGEILAGSTQSRALTMSQILMPLEKVVADCVCTYSTKGIRGGQSMEPITYTPTLIRREVYKGYYTRTGDGLDYQHGYQYDSRIQHNVWEGVNQYSQTAARRLSSLCAFASSSPDRLGDLGETLNSLGLDYTSPAQDLAGRVTESQDKLKEILKKTPKVDNQVGLVILTMTGLESMEAFNHPDSWEAIRKAILGSESDKIADISDQDNLFEFREEKAREIVLELLSKDYDEKVAVEKENTTTFILDEEKFMGEVVTLYDKPIHCAFMRKAS